MDEETVDSAAAKTAAELALSPLWVISGHSGPSAVMSELPPKPTFVATSGMSALGHKVGTASDCVGVRPGGQCRFALADIPVSSNSRERLNHRSTSSGQVADGGERIENRSIWEAHA
jgi:hypothetical protein